MENVRQMLDAGVSLATAIKEAIAQKGLTVYQFAEQYGIPSTNFSHAINGGGLLSERAAGALSDFLGGDPYEWRLLVWQAGRPEPSERATA